MHAVSLCAHHLAAQLHAHLTKSQQQDCCTDRTRTLTGCTWQPTTPSVNLQPQTKLASTTVTQPHICLKGSWTRQQVENTAPVGNKQQPLVSTLSIANTQPCWPGSHTMPAGNCMSHPPTLGLTHTREQTCLSRTAHKQTIRVQQRFSAAYTAHS